MQKCLSYEFLGYSEFRDVGFWHPCWWSFVFLDVTACQLGVAAIAGKDRGVFNFRVKQFLFFLDSLILKVKTPRPFATYLTSCNIQEDMSFSGVLKKRRKYHHFRSLIPWVSRTASRDRWLFNAPCICLGVPARCNRWRHLHIYSHSQFAPA
jgi:hypothetical protein